MYGDECYYGFKENIAVQQHMEGYHNGAGSLSDHINLKSLRKDSSEENAMSHYKGVMYFSEQSNINEILKKAYRIGPCHVCIT